MVFHVWYQYTMTEYDSLIAKLSDSKLDKLMSGLLVKGITQVIENWTKNIGVDSLIRC